MHRQGEIIKKLYNGTTFSSVKKPKVSISKLEHARIFNIGGPLNELTHIRREIQQEFIRLYSAPLQAESCILSYN